MVAFSPLQCRAFQERLRQILDVSAPPLPTISGHRFQRGSKAQERMRHVLCLVYSLIERTCTGESKVLAIPSQGNLLSRQS